jgi:hypothetical protein
MIEQTEKTITKEAGEITETQYTLETDADHAADQGWISHTDWTRIQDMTKLGYEVKLKVVVTERPGAKDSFNLHINLKRKTKINGKAIQKS